MPAPDEAQPEPQPQLPPQPSPRTPRWQLGFLFFWQGAVPALWMLAIGNILREKHLSHWLMLANAAPPLASLISPMFTGVLADRGMAPNRLLGGLFAGAGVLLWAGFYLLGHGGGGGMIAGFLIAQALFFQPTWSLMASVILGQLDNAPREYPLIRLWATLGWMLGGCAVSFGLHADSSPLAGMAAGATALCLALPTYLWLPHTGRVAAVTGPRTWSHWLGREAWGLLRDRDHRMVFVLSFLFSAPMIAFYPYTQQLLTALGDVQPAASLSAAQITEVVMMFLMPRLLVSVRLKWMVLIGLGCGALRYGLFALGAQTGSRTLVMAGIMLHGVLFASFYISTQIYLEQRVPRGVRAQAQAFQTFLTAGAGALAGVGLCWLWERLSTAGAGGLDWVKFWSGLALVPALLMGWVCLGWKGRGPAQGSGENA